MFTQIMFFKRIRILLVFPAGGLMQCSQKSYRTTSWHLFHRCELILRSRLRSRLILARMRASIAILLRRNYNQTIQLVYRQCSCHHQYPFYHLLGHQIQLWWRASQVIRPIELTCLDHTDHKDLHPSYQCTNRHF